MMNGAGPSDSSTTPTPPPARQSSQGQDPFTNATRQPAPTSSPPRSADEQFLIPDLPIRSRFQESSIRGGDGALPSLHTHVYAHPQNSTNGYQVSPRKRPRAHSDEDGEGDAARDSSPLKYRARTPSVHRHSSHGNGVEGPRTPPPSTPPPMFKAAGTVQASRASGRPQQPANAASFKDSEEGADLLLYLATSPSPAKARRSRDFLPGPSPRSGSNHHAHHAHVGGAFSSPPPLRASSQVNTPVGGGFNLSEFLNFTPSPAQAAAAHHPAHHMQTASGQTLSSRLAAAAAAAHGYTPGGGVKVSPIKLTYESTTGASPSRAVQTRLYGSRDEAGSSGYLEAALGSPSRRASAGGRDSSTMTRGARLDFM
jgi:hypothetical protein